MSGYTKFQLGFHIFILLAAIGIVIAYTLNDFQVFYMALGVIIGLGSLIQLIKLLKHPDTEK